MKTYNVTIAVDETANTPYEALQQAIDWITKNPTEVFASVKNENGINYLITLGDEDQS